DILTSTVAKPSVLKVRLELPLPANGVSRKLGFPAYSVG
ncbi:unnamed protein product, partial [marine sediment metagenome]